VRIDFFDDSDMDQVQSIAIQKGCNLSVFLCSFVRKTWCVFFLFFFSFASSVSRRVRYGAHFLIVLMFLLLFSDKAGCTDWNASVFVFCKPASGHLSLNEGLGHTSKLRPLQKKSEVLPLASLSAQILHLRSVFLSVNWSQYKLCLVNRKFI